MKTRHNNPSSIIAAILVLVIFAIFVAIPVKAQPVLADLIECCAPPDPNNPNPAEFPLGYPVPIPVDTDLPFDGFRTYNGLNLRHQDLADTPWAHPVDLGSTHAGRTIWAYQLGDTDLETTTGLPEPAMLTNGGIHAREWQSPETVTGIMELMVDSAGDNGFYDYLLENVNMVVIPVLNVDGFTQTQRYPSQAWFMADNPVYQQSAPRDGRLRRKNMLGVDEDINTQGDLLLGVDLNRNSSVFWATSSSSSGDPNSIVYHGASANSEPETQALHDAALLGPESQLRWYTDVHSFSQLHFWVRTPNPRQGNNSAALYTVFSNHHAAFPAGKFYFFLQPNQLGTNQGIGSTDGYFAYTYDIPAHTLEIEPSNVQSFGVDLYPNQPGCGADYGGFAFNCHDGFILPESQIRRVREELAQSFAVGYYKQAGPPALSALKVVDKDTQAVIYEAEWDVVDASSRVLFKQQLQPLALDEEYDIWLAWDKPMRWRDDTGGVTILPGQASNSLNVDANVDINGSPLTTIVGTPEWLNAPGGAPSGYQAYKDDALTATVRMPLNAVNTGLIATGEVASVNFSIDTFDMTGQRSDANPATPITWAEGGWSGYEDSNGVDQTDTGGVDATLSFDVSRDPQPTPFTIEPGTSAAWYDPNNTGEGFVIEILPDDRTVMYWFTYDENGDQAWYIAVGQVQGNQLVFPELIRTSGGQFGPDFDPDSIVREVVGSATFLYSGCNDGSMRYTIGNRKGRFALTRLSRVMGPKCGDFLGPPVREEAIQSGSWYPEGMDGQGFALEVLDDERVLVYWFTYDTEGNQAWFFGTGDIQGEELVFSELFTTSGPTFGPGFDSDDLVLTPWGEARFNLACDAGSMSFGSQFDEFGAAQYNLIRLSKLKELVCSE